MRGSAFSSWNRTIGFAVFLMLSLGAAAQATPDSVPGEVANLQWCSSQKDCLQWSSVTGALRYRLHRGEWASLPCVLNPALDSCDHGAYVTTTTGATVPESPAVGRFFWFLVIAENGSGAGSPGSATAGPRQVDNTGSCSPVCSPAGAVCSVDGDCCSANCASGRCLTECCQPAGVTCSTPSDCCSGICAGGLCQTTCASASQCPGTDTDCTVRTCTAGVCGFANLPAGTPTASQTPGDCHKNVCDGAGGVTSAVDDTDVPVDGNQCTSDTCVNGVPSNPATPLGTPCSQDGGVVCNGMGACVQCLAASDCPGTDTECQARTCTAFTCGFTFAPAGTPTASQTPGDCHRRVCNGSGGVTSAVDDTDVPVDGNQCTGDICTNGVPSNPPSPVGTPCNQGGGTICDGTGSCVTAPSVVSTSPADGAVTPAGTSIAVTFSQGMNPATLTGQTTAGACAGSIQVSLDGFASCVAFSSTSATMSGGNTVATFVPQPGLLVNRTYRIRVTTAALNAGGLPLAATYTHATGFTTTSPNLCDGSLVISQIYGGGGLSGAIYKNDFMEIHNRGTVAVSLAGMSVQYASATGSTWQSKTNLSGSIPPGGYYLVQGASDGANGSALPTPDAAGTINLSATVGKVALVSNQTSLTGACPLGATVIDFVGYGSTASCSEGGATAPSPSATTSIARQQAGCLDLNLNSTDFTAGVPAPRNSSTTAGMCGCVAQNESGAGLEADFCDTQFPLSMNAQTGTQTPVVYGQIYEAGVTEPPGANSSVRAQLGYGPVSANPEYQPGWTWVNATYNVQSGNNDEYQAQFTAPIVGMFRYVYRFSLDQGVSWTYCDNNQGDGGAGSNAGQTFDMENQAVLTVTP